MYHPLVDRSSTSVKLRQQTGGCIIMNNKEKNSYVRKQILKTLLEMMRVENFDPITISNLTEKAEVGRASFYRNYQTKEDVLRQEAERLNNELNDIRRNDDPTDYRLKLLRTLDFYKANSDFYMTIYNAGHTQIIQDSIVDSKSLSDEMSAPVAYVISAFSYLIYGWIIEWLRRGMKESSAELIAMFENSQKLESGCLEPK